MALLNTEFTVVMRVNVRARALLHGSYRARVCYAIFVYGATAGAGAAAAAAAGRLQCFRPVRGVLVRHLIACRIYDGAVAAS